MHVFPLDSKEPKRLVDETGSAFSVRSILYGGVTGSDLTSVVLVAEYRWPMEMTMPYSWENGDEFDRHGPSRHEALIEAEGWTEILYGCRHMLLKPCQELPFGCWQALIVIWVVHSLGIEGDDKAQARHGPKLQL